MPTLPGPDEGLSRISAMRRLLRNWIVLSSSSVRRAIAPSAISGAEQQRVGPFSGWYDLLLSRMEALQLEPAEVRRIETEVFQDLAAACSTCEHTAQCERDVAYMSAGKITFQWEEYCRNTTILNAMRKLPWFGKQERDPP